MIKMPPQPWSGILVKFTERFGIISSETAYCLSVFLFNQFMNSDFSIRASSSCCLQIFPMRWETDRSFSSEMIVQMNGR